MADHTNSDMPDPVQMEIIRRMTPAQRIGAAIGLDRAARRMLRAHLIDQHPDWTADQVGREVTRRMTSGHR
ncbi:MAG: hypothetical protein PHU85_19715 [Phycisphaerae bacterium]|nr:hypothetical protein [Phycisphaerae bacterium]